jgi:hypothetical protein
MASTLMFALVRRVLGLIGLDPNQTKGTSRSPSWATSWQWLHCQVVHPSLRTHRSAGPGHAGQDVALGAVRVPGHAGDAVALASREKRRANDCCA